MEFQPLFATQDAMRLHRLFDAAADCVTLETGAPPNDDTVPEFFSDCPPDIGPDDVVHIGCFVDGVLIGVINLSFGYPDTSDSYIGLLIVDPTMCGRGMGTRAAEHAAQIARDRGAARQFIAVLDANPKGCAFWERVGFVHERTFPPSRDRHTHHRMVRAL